MIIPPDVLGMHQIELLAVETEIDDGKTCSDKVQVDCCTGWKKNFEVVHLFHRPLKSGHKKNLHLSHRHLVVPNMFVEFSFLSMVVTNKVDVMYCKLSCRTYKH